MAKPTKTVPAPIFNDPLDPSHDDGTGALRVHTAADLRSYLDHHGFDDASGDDWDLDVDDSAIVATGPAAAPASSGVSGTLSEFSVLELLQMFTTTNRTGEFRVTSPQGSGRMYLREGGVYAAFFVAPFEEEVAGVDAVTGLAALTVGDFRFGPTPGEGPLENLQLPTTSLLIILATAGEVHQDDEVPEGWEDAAGMVFDGGSPPEAFPPAPPGDSEVPYELDPAYEIPPHTPSPFDEVSLEQPGGALQPGRAAIYKLVKPLPGRLTSLSPAQLDVVQAVHDGDAGMRLGDDATEALEQLVALGFVVRF